MKDKMTTLCTPPVRVVAVAARTAPPPPLPPLPLSAWEPKPQWSSSAALAVPTHRAAPLALLAALTVLLAKNTPEKDRKLPSST